MALCFHLTKIAVFGHLAKSRWELYEAIEGSQLAETGVLRDVSHPGSAGILTLTMLVTTIDAQWEGMGDVGLARYEPALLPPCPTIRVLSYSN